MSYVPCRCAVCAACCDAACAAHLMVRRRPRERRRRKLHASHTNARCALKSLLAAYFRRFLDELLLNGHAARMGVCEDSTAGVRAFAARCIWCNVLARVQGKGRGSAGRGLAGRGNLLIVCATGHTVGGLGGGRRPHAVAFVGSGARWRTRWGRWVIVVALGLLYLWAGCAVAHTVGGMGGDGGLWRR